MIKITIFENNKKIFKLKLPYILFSNRIITRYLEKKINIKSKILKENLKYLKKYVKENGHFTLVEVNSANDKVKIEI